MPRRRTLRSRTRSSPTLQERVGRVVWNGFATGVAVTRGDGARWAVPRDHERLAHVGRIQLHPPLSQAGLLPGRSGRAASGRAQRRQPTRDPPRGRRPIPGVGEQRDCPLNGSDLEGRVALVTGSERGIGAAIALRLAAGGANIAVNAYQEPENASEVAERVAELGVKSCVVTGDVSVAADVHRMVDERASRSAPSASSSTTPALLRAPCRGRLSPSRSGIASWR